MNTEHNFFFRLLDTNLWEPSNYPIRRDLLARKVLLHNASIQTVDIVVTLPKLTFEESTTANISGVAH